MMRLAGFDRVLGRKLHAFDSAWLAQMLARYPQVALDIGTGDGRYVLDLARNEPDLLCLGIDPVAEAMETSSRVSSAKRGGCPNAIFMRSSLEQLPGPLEGIADRLSVNYPWGSLLAAVARAERRAMAQLRATCKVGATVSIYLNFSVFEDRSYSDRLGLGGALEFLSSGTFVEAFAASGFTVVAHRLFEGDPPFRSAWGRQLVRNSGRRSMHIEARACSVTPAVKGE